MKLTAEQVRETIVRHSILFLGCSRLFVDGSYWEIANELNATIGTNECEMYRDEYGVWHCSSCEKGADKITGNDGTLESWNDLWPPNFCPYCGAKVKEVKR